MYVTDWTFNQSQRLDIQSVTRIGRFLKPSNPSHGLDIQSVTPYCHGLDVQSKSQIGRPNRDLDCMVLASVQSNSQIGRPIRDKPGWPSNPSHGLDVQSVTSMDDRPNRDIRMSRFGHCPIRGGLDNRTYMIYFREAFNSSSL